MMKLLLLPTLLLLSAPDEEVPPAKHIDCFPGAIYRKAVSSNDVWTGIEAVVTLPTLTTDPNRLDDKGRPMDNASVYLGGNASGTEIDAGVSWEIIKEPDGQPSTSRKAFRPFWRNKKWFTGPADPKFYFYPGDTLRMTCWTDAPDRLRIKIELLYRKPQPGDDDKRDFPISVLEESFDAPGFGPGRVQQFKRVNAIDQFKNEGKAVSSTKATSLQTIWAEATLLRGDQRRPMTADRFTDMRCPDGAHVTVRNINTSGEIVDLVGSP